MVRLYVKVLVLSYILNNIKIPQLIHISFFDGETTRTLLRGYQFITSYNIYLECIYVCSFIDDKVNYITDPIYTHKQYVDNSAPMYSIVLFIDHIKDMKGTITKYRFRNNDKRENKHLNIRKLIHTKVYEVTLILRTECYIFRTRV